MPYPETPFERALFEGGEQVYQQILSGDVPDVEAALMDVHLTASAEAETPDN